MEVKEGSKLNFFDFLNSINAGPGKPSLMADVQAEPGESVSPDSPEKAYVAFMVNRGLSYFSDSVLLANEMNRASHLHVKMQYDFLRNSLRPRKRFSKWLKASQNGEDVQVIKEHYGYSTEKALEALPLFSRESLDALHALHSKGGLINKTI
jgi:hypothetical protein